ncbi:ABC transporter permease [Loigolactobacillus backii]|uniref:ABC transporter permease n=1 Tax=Loigolactobacillus backii TaxID=375175 RepID=UPI000C1C9FC0|nr:ABC transporter permease [Loigolactobacillus backii]PIO82600.1 ABC transporter permease [Loigolactobacillus backii]
MRIIALVNRILKQMRRSPRTIILMFVAPLFILTLMYLLLSTNNTVKTRVGIYQVNDTIVTNLKSNKLTLKSFNNKNKLQAKMKQHDLDAFITVSGKKIDVTYQNSDLSKTAYVKNTLRAGLMKMNTKALINVTKAQRDVITRQQQALLVLTKQQPPAQKAPSKPTNYQISNHYLYSNGSATFFDQALPALIAFFVFFFVFLISGISLLSERTSGTLSRLLATPIKRNEIIYGYLCGYGIFAVIQTFIIVFFTVYILKIQLVGSIWLVLLTNILVALIALAMGIFASTFAQNEFQMMQFIPLLVIPQVFFSGLIPIDGMAHWLQAIAHIMPLYYAGTSLQNVITKGYTFSDIGLNLLILLGFAILFIWLNIRGMRRFRKV